MTDELRLEVTGSLPFSVFLFLKDLALRKLWCLTFFTLFLDQIFLHLSSPLSTRDFFSGHVNAGVLLAQGACFCLPTGPQMEARCC